MKQMFQLLVNQSYSLQLNENLFKGQKLLLHMKNISWIIFVTNFQILILLFVLMSYPKPKVVFIFTYTRHHIIFLYLF